MKRLIAFTALVNVLVVAQASAHGNLFEQASGATSTCLDVMLKNEPKKIIRLFQSVQTTILESETFSVVVQLKDDQRLEYKAIGVEDESDRFSWQCSKN